LFLGWTRSFPPALPYQAATAYGLHPPTLFFAFFFIVTETVCCYAKMLPASPVSAVLLLLQPKFPHLIAVEILCPVLSFRHPVSYHGPEVRRRTPLFSLARPGSLSPPFLTARPSVDCLSDTKPCFIGHYSSFFLLWRVTFYSPAQSLSEPRTKCR